MTTIRMVIRNGAPGLVDCDAPMLRNSRQPLLDGARALLAAGAKPRDILELARRPDGPWDLRARIGVAAKLTVREEASGGTPPTFAPYRPGPKGRALLAAEGQGRAKTRSPVSP